MTKQRKGGSAGAESKLEIERKFELPTDFELPDLTGLTEGGLAGRPVVHQLEATYFDTDDLRLLAARRTLRRRTGGPDAGWHLKEPGDGADVKGELVLPLGRSTRTVPQALQDAVAVYTRGRSLAPIATLSTTRTVTTLSGPDDAPLAEVMIDEVASSGMGPDGEPLEQDWRELEVEVVGPDAGVLEPIATRLVAAGALPSSNASKLARAMGRPGRVAPARRRSADPSTDGVAVAAMLDYLSTEVAHLMASDPSVRAERPDAVHQFRVACRRLRSALATFRHLLDRSRTDPLSDELRWIGAELGAARDAEVVRDALLNQVRAEPSGLRRGPVVRRIRETLDGDYRRARAQGLAAMRSERYYCLLDDLDTLLADPPLTSGAERKGRRALVRMLERSRRRVERRRAALAEAGPGETDAVLHGIRKAAKRARYAGEALAPVLGAQALEQAESMSRVQSLLGDHQDTVVIRAELVALADAAQEAGEPTFTYGRLHALAQSRGDRTAQALAEVWPDGGSGVAADRFSRTGDRVAG